ncbi:MAG TPA: DUF6066 family protein [Myxococcaceae bacterium]|nr:DUF6066 family protein [Myxococcaceae bacterium]
MLVRSAFTLLALLPGLALAEGRFDELKKEAQPFEGGLGEFLELYLGDCGTASNTANCKNRSKEFQTQAKGKRFYALVREDEAGMVGMSDSTRSGGDFTIEVTPFFPGAEHALTNAVPKKTDAKGNPILPVLMFAGKLPGVETVDDMERLFKNRGVRLELLFRPEQVWALPKKGGGQLTGVKAKLDAIQVTSRTGAVLATWIAPDA